MFRTNANAEGENCKAVTYKFKGAQFKGFLCKNAAKVWLKERGQAQVQDQDAAGDRVLDCVAELSAFARGGPYAMQMLQKVYRNILSHFKIPKDEFCEVMYRANLHFERGRIRLVDEGDEEEDDVFRCQIVSDMHQ